MASRMSRPVGGGRAAPWHRGAGRRLFRVASGFPVPRRQHDPETLAWFVDADVSCGSPSILNMIAEGKITGPDRKLAETLCDQVAARSENGPLPFSALALKVLRYEITDAVDDLRCERTAEEALATGAMLHPKLVELALRGRGH